MGNISPLRKAMFVNDTGKVREILDEAGEGAPDYINEDYTSDCLCSRERNVQSPLHTAIGKGQTDIVELLLQNGADVDMPGLWGQTALHQAAKQNNRLVCQKVVQCGAEIYAEDYDGKKPIHSASMSFVSSRTGNIDALKYILEELGKPDDVHFTDVDGRTPLHDAAKWGNKLAAEYLIIKGADPKAQSYQGKTPLDEAMDTDRTELVKLLNKYKT